jgi:long-chain acyl-CoA synthetase
MEAGLQERARQALAAPAHQRAIWYGGIWYDWGWVRDCGARVIELLDLAGADDRPIGLVPRNRPTSAAALLALIASGRSIRMAFAFQSASALARELAAGELAAVVANDEDCSRPLAEALALAGIPLIAMDEEAGIGMLGEPVESAGAPGAEAEPAIEILTSGTSGPPKHFRLTHTMVLRGLLASNLSYPQPSDDPDMPKLMFFPIGSISGLYRFLPPMLDGHPLIMLEKFDLDVWLRYVAFYRPKRMTLPPTGIVSLLQRDVPPAALESVRYIGTGAAPIDPLTQRAFEKRYGIPLLISYGATEFGGPVAAMTAELRADWGDAKLGSAGRAWGNAQLRTVDPETGTVRGPGEQGLLEVISPTIGGGWIRTSDVAVIDQDGFLFHQGRADGAISRGGFSILPEVIERAIRSHPAVLDAAVVGLYHRRLGEVPVAAVQPRDEGAPPDLADLENHVRDQVYATHVPVQFRIVQALPLTQSMKVDLGKVRALFEREIIPARGRAA